MEPTVTILRGAIYEVRLPRNRKRPPRVVAVEPRNRVWFDLRISVARSKRANESVLGT